MITTFLVEHRWVAPALLLLLLIVCPLVGSWLTRHGLLTRWLSAVSVLAVLALTLVPTDRQLEVGCTVQWALPMWGRVELVANVALFAAPVMLLGILLRRPVVAFVGGAAFSALIETVQAVVPAIGRSCDTTDWLSNAIGSGIGALLAVVALQLARRRDRIG